MNFNKTRCFCGLIFLVVGGLNIFGQDTRVISSITNVSYCDLIREPLKYDKKVIRLEVIYVIGFESAAMYDETCRKVESTWIEYDSALKDTTDSKVWEKFKKLTDTTPVITKNEVSFPTRQVKVSWIGVFHAQNTAPLSDIVDFSDKSDSDNQLFYELPYGFKYYFTVQKIEEIAPFVLENKK
jgi:hypothetical protein